MIEESSMKRIVKAALLTSLAAALPMVLFAQGAAAPAAGAASGQCQMPDAEYQVYNNANTQTDNKAKAAALESYLTQFPNSCAKLGALDAIARAYAAVPDNAKAIATADKILQLDPNNFRALTYETFLHKAAADAISDPDAKKQAAAKQPELDQAASFAQKGLVASKPADMADADYANAKLVMYSAIALDAMDKGDYAGAIDAYKKEIAFVQADPKLAPQLQTPSQTLQDMFYLGEAYRQSNPPDYLSCAFYETRAAAFAPANFKAIMSPTAQYCYKKYHGKADGYDPQFVQFAQASVNPPADLATTVTPAPTPAQMIADILKTNTPDQLATADKEYILQNGSPDQVQQVWDSMKGKSLEFPDVLVVASTPQQLQVAATDGAKAEKTADFTFNLAPPEELPARATPLQKKNYDKKQAAIAAAIAPGQTVTLSGTFDSYTPKPFMITMSDGQVVLPEAAKPTKPSPAHRAPAAHRAK
jgi:tetratricopeptide (TPR) repeat protein